jgi:hypothetical protein
MKSDIIDWSGMNQERKDGPMKTLTKKQLVDILDQVPDENPVYIYVEIGDVDLARRYVPAGVTLLRLGLPGDHSIDDSGVGLLTWAVSE